MTSSETKAEIFVKFDGKDAKKFREWSTKIKAVASQKGWLDALLTDLKLNRSSTVKAEVDKVLQNDLAYHYLVMACTEYAFGYVQAAETKDSHGDARKAWESLCKRYNDVTENDLIALTTEYNNCKLKKASNDPNLWYAEIDHLMLKMERAGAQQKSEKEVVAFIMSQIPAEYKVATQALRVKPVDERTLELVKNVYSEFWGSKFKNKESMKSTEDNVALYTDGGKKPWQKNNSWKKFKGMCSWC